MVALFLAILEMVKVQAVVLTQKGAFGDISLKRHKPLTRRSARRGDCRHREGSEWKPSI